MELEEILTKVLEIQVDEHATIQLQRLISENPRWAEEITECWDLHRQMSCSKNSESTRFLSDWDSYEILDEVDRGPPVQRPEELEQPSGGFAQRVVGVVENALHAGLPRGHLANAGSPGAR
jgi:hypothetical protein